MKIEDPLCQRYSCLRVENINRHVSPMAMRIRLNYCGMRDINFLADLTNYLMLEMGQPMHAFDSRKVEKIRIRRFPESFPFQTLDKVERTIDPNTLMICNGDKPVAIAGIMGGLDSEIVDDTTSLTLESATFDAASVRKSSVRLAHRTDASARYEKSLDPEMTTVAIARFVKLLQEYDPEMRVTSRLTDEYAFHYPKVQLSFDKAFVDRYTGINISSDEIMHTLTALGFGMTRDGDSFTADVPSWRATKDVTIKADIIEEITRIYGYDNFDLHTAESPLYPVRMSTEKTVEDKLKDILVKRYSLHEVHSYIWQYADDYKKLGIAVEDNVKLLNASNPNIETLRRSMIPTQLCQVKVNTGYAPSFGIFEIGHIVDGVDENKLAKEHKKLCVTLFSKVDNVETLYFRLRDMLCVAVSDILHKDLSFHAMTATHSYEHPKNLNAIVWLHRGETEKYHTLVAGYCAALDMAADCTFAQRAEQLQQEIASVTAECKDAVAAAARKDKKRIQAQYDESLAAIQEKLTIAKEACWLTDKFGDGEYRDIPGLCKAATLQEIEEKNWSLTPGAYVGVEAQQADDVDFAERMREIHAELLTLQQQSDALMETISRNWEEMGV